MYKVIERFADLLDDNHIYNAGDDYPRKGLEVTEERLEELAGWNNKQHKPLIKAVRKRTKKAAE
jgi:hypothetical protein